MKRSRTGWNGDETRLEWDGKRMERGLNWGGMKVERGFNGGVTGVKRRWNGGGMGVAQGEQGLNGDGWGGTRWNVVERVGTGNEFHLPNV